MTFTRVKIENGNLGLAIKAFRKVNRLSQEKFGEMIGLPNSRISVLEHTGSNLSSQGKTWDEYFEEKPKSKQRDNISAKVRELISLDRESIPKASFWRLKNFTFSRDVIMFINKKKLLPGQFQILNTGHSLYDVVYWEEKKEVP